MKNKTTYNRSMHDKKHPYTLISAKLINNSELTGEERFLLIYLLGRSNDYILHSSYFAQKSKDLFGWGRDKFQKYWNSLQEKGYIVKDQIREKGQAAGCHYKVYEVLKNRNPENPGTGDSSIRQTSALPSIDKPNIDIPNIDKPISATSTNLNGERKIPPAGSTPIKGIVKSNEEVRKIFDYVCQLNPSEHSDNWKLNDKDGILIQKAIDKYGYSDALIQAVIRIGECKKPYCSISYIFSDLKKKENIDTYLENNPEEIDGFISITLPYEETEESIKNCLEEEHVYEIIKNAASFLHTNAKYWKPSEEDLEHCERLMHCDSNIDLIGKLRSGLKSAFKKNDWRFGQIVYQAMTAIENRELWCS